jgi:SAM-dependent methyltransferase
MNCRHCQAPVSLPLVDLGSAPYSNAYLNASRMRAPEKWYPLRVLVCTTCWLAQTDEMSDRSELFSPDYAYFSSYSTTMLQHAERYVATMVERFGLSGASRVVEVASNDGYLLQYVQARGINTLGIEPTASTAAAAREKGLEVVEEFFGVGLADQLVADGRSAHLALGNNVLAHVPDINDFVSGFARLLTPDGIVTFEFPHLVRLIEDVLFDTIYHEHYSYLSLTAALRILERNGLRVFDVELVPIHGGSLRVYAHRLDGVARSRESRLDEMLMAEAAAGVATPAFYEHFQTRVDRVKDDFVSFLIEARRSGRRVAAYGAAAKANTLMNYAGIRRDLIPFVVDRNPSKRDKFMPGSRIPIVDEAELRVARPDFIVLFPWNLRRELSEQLQYARDWGARLVTAIPELVID